MDKFIVQLKDSKTADFIAYTNRNISAHRIICQVFVEGHTHGEWRRRVWEEDAVNIVVLPLFLFLHRPSCATKAILRTSTISCLLIKRWVNKWPRRWRRQLRRKRWYVDSVWLRGKLYGIDRCSIQPRLELLPDNCRRGSVAVGGLWSVPFKQTHESMHMCDILRKFVLFWWFCWPLASK